MKTKIPGPYALRVYSQDVEDQLESLLMVPDNDYAEGARVWLTIDREGPDKRSITLYSAEVRALVHMLAHWLDELDKGR
jgi:hypothetical protein